MNFGSEIFFYRKLKEELLATLDQYTAEILDGSPRDWAEYRHLAGLVSGLRRALALADDLHARILKN